MSKTKRRWILGTARSGGTFSDYTSSEALTSNYIPYDSTTSVTEAIAQALSGTVGPIGFTGLQGATGPLGGPAGATGIGIQGVTGLRGVTGIRGITGLGMTGLQGETGVQGIQGDTGIQGETGPVGPAGLTGAPGIQGATGFQGITGSLGVQGITGDPGLGATGIQGQTGAKGSTGLQGMTGLRGETGIQGITGSLGNTGARGVTGIGLQGQTGAQGTTGSLGNTGARGVTGIEGLQGQTGAQGQTGLRGVTGIQGVSLAIVPQGTDRAAIQEAIDYLEASGDKGGVIYLPAGEYSIDASNLQGLVIGNGKDGTNYSRGSGISIIGAGAHKTVLRMISDTTYVGISIQGGTDGTTPIVTQNTVLRDFQIATDFDNSHTGLLVEYACDSLVENIRIGSESEVVAGRFFKYGMKVTSWTNTFNSCQICGVRDTGILLSSAVILGSASFDTKILSSSITNFYKTDATAYGIYLENTGSSVIVGNTIQANINYMPTVGIRSAVSNMHTYIAGNHFEADATGIILESVGNTLVGNFFATVPNPIYIDPATKSGNVVWGNYVYGGVYDNFYLYGKMGIDTNNPLEKLDVSGGVKVGWSDGSNAGTLRWNSGISKIQVYDSTNWVSLN